MLLRVSAPRGLGMQGVPARGVTGVAGHTPPSSWSFSSRIQGWDGGQEGKRGCGVEDRRGLGPPRLVSGEELDRKPPSLSPLTALSPHSPASCLGAKLIQATVTQWSGLNPQQQSWSPPLAVLGPGWLWAEGGL